MGCSLYRYGMAVSRNPAQEVEDTLRLAHSTAARWIRHARPSSEALAEHSAGGWHAALDLQRCRARSPGGSQFSLGLSLPRAERERIVPLRIAHASALADAAPERCRVMVITQAGLGLRVVELFGVADSGC